MVSLEVAGPYAMWTNPASGDAPVSYPVPTYSAVKGLFESILFVPWADVVPIRVEICKPIVYSRFTFNYRGPLRKKTQIREDTSYQAKWTILQDVCYKLYGIPRGLREAYDVNGISITTNGAHAFQERFQRILERGGYRMTPHLGCKEFGTWYCGPIRLETVVQSDINMKLPSILDRLFTERFSNKPHPNFKQNISIRNGVFEYA